MKAPDLLREQHRQVMDLFENVLDAEDPEERQALMDEIVDELQLHSQIEEEIFYPAIREEGAAAERMVLHALEEHHAVDLLLAELPSLDAEDEHFEAKMTVLRDLVEHHVELEEKELFKLARKFDKDELGRLGARLEARARELTGERERTEEHRPHERI